MNERIDRTHIADLLLPIFPAMAGATSDDWHGFLNEITGLAVALDEDNASAFDQWRRRLGAMGYPVWDATPAREAEIAARGRALADRAKAWQAEQASAAAVEVARLAEIGLTPLPAVSE